MSAGRARPAAHGTVAPGYERVAEAFAATMLTERTAGGALCVLRDGEVVVDLWGGLADHVEGREWRADTPTVVFSCTKGVLAVLAAKLVGSGDLDLDAPVARYWPEFAAAGKGAVTVGDAMAHRAGLAALRDDVDLATALDWDAIVTRIAAAEPLWRPGSGHAYHALTYGWIVGEVLRRITGLLPGELLAQILTGPLDAELWIGVPAEVEPRIARLRAGDSLRSPGPEPEAAAAPTPQQQELMLRSMTLGRAFPAELVVRDAGFDAVEVHRAQVPGAGGVATARGLASVWSSTVVGTGSVDALDTGVLAAMTRVRSEGMPVWPQPAPHQRWGAGFQLPSGARTMLSSASFGHDGAGGQLAFADPAHRVGFAYVTDVFEGHGDARAATLVAALQAVVSG